LLKKGVNLFCGKNDEKCFFGENEFFCKNKKSAKKKIFCVVEIYEREN